MGNINNEKISRKLITINKGLDRAMYQTSQSKDGIIENDTNLYEDKLIEALLTNGYNSVVVQTFYELENHFFVKEEN